MASQMGEPGAFFLLSVNEALPAARDLPKKAGARLEHLRAAEHRVTDYQIRSRTFTSRPFRVPKRRVKGSIPFLSSLQELSRRSQA